MKTDQILRRVAPALAGLLLIGSAQAAAPPTQWTVLSASGDVEFTRDRTSSMAWQTLARGAQLPVAASVRTGADGRATLDFRNFDDSTFQATPSLPFRARRTIA